MTLPVVGDGWPSLDAWVERNWPGGGCYLDDDGWISYGGATRTSPLTAYTTYAPAADEETEAEPEPQHTVPCVEDYAAINAGLRRLEEEREARWARTGEVEF